jgi:hypothetical protein
MNGALKLSATYRGLVEDVVEHLDPRVFAVPRIRELLADDLRVHPSRLCQLFEILITFGLYDREWGPNGRKRLPRLGQ